MKSPPDPPAVPVFGDVVGDHARLHPDAIALHFAGRVWTYGDYDRVSNRIARALLRTGHAAGDRIGFVGHNSDLIALAALGVSKAGMIFVPVNWRLAHAEAEHILLDAGIRLLINAGDAPAPTGPWAMLPAAALAGDGDWLADDAAPCAIVVQPQDTTLLIYTSGTTGLPKGVMLSHRSLFATSLLRRAAAVPWDRWSADDVTLVPIPLAHIGGFGMMARTLFFGGQTVIQRGFDAGNVLAAIETLRVSKLALVPTAIRMVIDHPRARQVDYSRIGTIVYGAAPITLDLLRAAMVVFGCQFAQSYGMSETSGTCVVLPPEDHDVRGTPRMRAAGKPLPGTELRIVDDAGNVLPPQTTGEISIRSISLMNGYWNQPEATARVIDAAGWYRTGDAGTLDADGYLFVVDRIKDMIVSGAENIYPAEVENAIAGHPDIAEVAVIGIPDPLWGEAVRAIVVAAPGRTVDPDSVIAWARTRIAGYKVPKSVKIVDALPCNATGKVQKTELRRRYSQ